MNRDEILKMLELAPQEVRQPPVAVLEVPEDRPKSDTVLRTDEWDREQGARLVQSQGLRKSQEAEMADFFAAAFGQSPEVVGECPDQMRQKFIEDLLETPEYKSLHTTTQLNVVQSKIAAVEFRKQFAALQNELDLKRKRFQAPKNRGSNDPNTQKDGEDMACLKAVNLAVQAAQDEIDEFEEMCRGIGTDPNAQNSELDMERVASAFQRVKDNSMLREIMQKSGRFRRVAQTEQRQKTVHGYDDMIGVEMAGDVSRLLPLEMAMLADEMFETLALKRLVEKQSMCRQFQGIENEAKGPVVICIDESGSMKSLIADAKAFAMSMGWIASHQKRWIMFVSFYAGHATKMCVRKPGAKNEDEFLDWLGSFFNGGSTDMTVPLEVVPELWGKIGCPKGKTDMIIITDDEVEISKSEAERFLKFKAQEKVKLTTIVLGGGQGTNMKQVSDEVFSVGSISTDSEAVKKCFQI